MILHLYTDFSQQLEKINFVYFLIEKCHWIKSSFILHLYANFSEPLDEMLVTDGQSKESLAPKIPCDKKNKNKILLNLLYLSFPQSFLILFRSEAPL